MRDASNKKRDDQEVCVCLGRRGPRSRSTRYFDTTTTMQEFLSDDEVQERLRRIKRPAAGNACNFDHHCGYWARFPDKTLRNAIRDNATSLAIPSALILTIAASGAMVSEDDFSTANSSATVASFKFLFVVGMATSFGASLGCLIKCSTVMDAIERVPDSALLSWIIHVKTGWFADWDMDMQVSLWGLLVMFVSSIQLFYGGWEFATIAVAVPLIFMINALVHGGRMYSGIEDAHASGLELRHGTDAV